MATTHHGRGRHSRTPHLGLAVLTVATLGLLIWLIATLTAAAF